MTPRGWGAGRRLQYNNGVPTDPLPRRKWRPTPFLVLMLLAHTLWLGSIVRAPGQWRRHLAVLAGLHLVLALPGANPRSTWLGPNVSRLPSSGTADGQVALTFDDGPDPEVTPQVLALLAERGWRATFFLIGERAERHPELVRALVAAGHRVENHTYHHRFTFAFSLWRGMRLEIERAQRALAAVAGRPPAYFRAPAGMHSFVLGPVLARLDLTLVSWTRRGFDTLERDPQRVVERLCEDLAAGDILLLHDGNCARTPEGEPVVLEALPRVLQALADRGLRAVPLPDP
jgi:peptidoglycan/xylan/chitin deacetylase (PgdA/CDA1 family)